MKVGSGDKISEVIEKIQDNNFTIVPVEDGYGDAVGYVHIEDLEKADGKDTIREIQKDLRVENILPPYIGFEETVRSLYRNFFYFIGGTTGIDGIITRADLNTKPSRSYLFRRFLEFEKLIEDYIEEEVHNWVELASKDIESINRRYEQAESDDVQLTKISYANFDTKIGILAQHDETKEKLQYDRNGGDFTDKLTRLKDDVANGNPIIHNFSERGTERGIGEMIELIDHMNEIQTVLQNKD